MNIEFYDRIYKRDNHRPVELEKIIEWSTTNKKLKTTTDIYRQWLKDNPNLTTKEKTEMKVKTFSDVQFSGTFSGSGKSEDIKELSGLIVLDFDHIENLETIREVLRHEINIYLMFVSPSGDGLKLVIKHNLKDPSKWLYLFKELREYYEFRTKQKLDLNGSDISRGCHIPFIENLYRNEHSIPWNYTGQFEKTETEHKPQTEITEDIYKECFYLSTFISENKINICDDYNDWLSFGYSLCPLGENGRMIFHHISSVSKKYNYKETDRKYTKLLETFDPEKTDINKYLYHSKMSIIDFILYKKYGFIPDNKQ